MSNTCKLFELSEVHLGCSVFLFAFLIIKLVFFLKKLLYLNSGIQVQLVLNKLLYSDAGRSSDGSGAQTADFVLQRETFF